MNYIARTMMQGASRASRVTNPDKWKEEKRRKPSVRVQLEERLLFFTGN